MVLFIITWLQYIVIHQYLLVLQNILVFVTLKFKQIVN